MRLGIVMSSCQLRGSLDDHTHWRELYLVSPAVHWLTVREETWGSWGSSTQLTELTHTLSWVNRSMPEYQHRILNIRLFRRHFWRRMNRCENLYSSLTGTDFNVQVQFSDVTEEQYFSSLTTWMRYFSAVIILSYWDVGSCLQFLQSLVLDSYGLVSMESPCDLVLCSAIRSSYFPEFFLPYMFSFPICVALLAAHV